MARPVSSYETQIKLLSILVVIWLALPLLSNRWTHLSQKKNLAHGVLVWIFAIFKRSMDLLWSVGQPQTGEPTLGLSPGSWPAFDIGPPRYDLKSVQTNRWSPRGVLSDPGLCCKPAESDKRYIETSPEARRLAACLRLVALWRSPAERNSIV